MFHFIYKTTNNINNKYYYGVHSTTNINDGYLGSGDQLKRAIKKYGKENFSREIISLFDTRNKALLYEKELININIINDDKSYNICEGGGSPPIRNGVVAVKNLLKGDKRTEKQKNASKLHSEKMKNNIPWNKGTKGKQVAWNKGIPNLKLKENLSKTQICPHCNKSGNGLSMIRWHFDNCKMK
jgi:group I intron endonuclease